MYVRTGTDDTSILHLCIFKTSGKNTKKWKWTFLMNFYWAVADFHSLIARMGWFLLVTNALLRVAAARVAVMLPLRAWATEYVPPFFRTFSCSKLKIWRFNFLRFGLIFNPVGWGGVKDTHASLTAPLSSYSLNHWHLIPTGSTSFYNDTKFSQRILVFPYAILSKPSIMKV